MDDFLNPETVFPNTNIRGGLCYFLWDASYNNASKGTRVITHNKDGIQSDIMRPLRTEGVETFIRSFEAISILKKVQQSDFVSLSKYISSRKPFGLPTDFTKDVQYKGTPDVLSHPILCYGKGLCIGYIERSIIKMHTEWIDKWKILIPRANNIGTELSDDNLNGFLCGPGEVTTESYLVVGADLNMDKNKSLNLIAYLSTKFARFMHSIAKASQDATQKTFIFVPLQDFSKQWTDADLYVKYHLTKDEIAYIEEMIKPMANTTLFNPDETLDPNFGYFDLEEHGVKVGDHIIYTPTETELVVRENNMVEAEGELYTIAQFTAKYIPRNKRSVSGVCQGPKYFSYNGTTLYQMKESFLGGSK